MKASCSLDVEDQYRTIEKLQKTDVDELEEWIQTQPHLPQTSEGMIILFLSCNKFNKENTQKCIESYYTVRTSFTSVFTQRDPLLEKNVTVMNAFISEPLSQLTPEGYGVFYSKILDPSLDIYDYPTQVKLFDMRLHAWLQETGCVNGIISIVDMSGSTLRHVQKMGFFNVKKVLAYMTDGLPVQLKGVHFVNPTNFIDACFKILFPMISEELRQCLHVHHGESLFEHIPKNCVPDELGGHAGSIKSLHDNFVQVLTSNRDYFIKDETLKADETKRIRQGLFKRLGF